MYQIVLSEQAREDYSHFVRSGSQAIVRKIEMLLEDIAAHPFTGLGKPEPLRFSLTGKWSRRINLEHRIVYQVNGEKIEVDVLSMRYHYTKY